jgi:uncharacterized protein
MVKVGTVKKMITNKKSNNNIAKEVKCDGSINACKRCSGLFCCGILEENGRIEPSYLTAQDIKNIEYYTGLHRDQFATAKINEATGNRIYMMQTSVGHGCIFFDHTSGKCEIHSFRPMDCRLFPLDIEYVDGKYHWALFKYTECKVSKMDLKSLYAYTDEALRLLGDELHEYATLPVPGMSEIGYKLLKEINFESEDHDNKISPNYRQARKYICPTV